MWLYFFVLFGFFSVLFLIIAAICASYIMMGISQFKTGVVEQNRIKKRGGLIAFLVAAVALILVVVVFIKLVFPIIGLFD